MLMADAVYLLSPCGRGPGQFAIVITAHFDESAAVLATAGGSNHSITGKLWPHDITFKMEETRTATLTCDQLFLKNVCREFQPLAPKSDRGQDNGGSQNKHIWVIGHKEQTCL